MIGRVRPANVCVGGVAVRARSRRRPRLRLLSALAGMAFAGFAGAAAPALAAPSWGIATTHLNAYGGSTEGFARGSGGNAYRITVTNVANGPASEDAIGASASVTVKDELPVGFVLAGAGSVAEGAGWSCPSVEALLGPRNEYRARSITCIRQAGEAELLPGDAYPPLIVHVYVEPPPAEVAEPAVNHASVEGGSASSVEAADGETPVSAGALFGIHEFALGDDDAESKPAGAAGAHPDHLTTNLVWNSAPNFAEQLVGAGGGADEYGVGPKSIEVTIPRGLIGDPENVKIKCSLGELRQAKHQCGESAVGYIEYNFTIGSIGGDGSSHLEPTEKSLLYDVVAPAGHAAAFGFLDNKAELPFLIYAQPSAEDEYRLVVGTEAAGPLRSATITFCSYGAREEELAEEKTIVECLRPSAPAKPFLSNPTQCTEAPLATLKTEPWYESPTELEQQLTPKGQEELKENRTRRTYLLGESESEQHEKVANTFNECAKLTYKRTPTPEPKKEPSVSIEPTPGEGTTQSDAPTPVSLGLKIPQSNSSSELATPALKNLSMTLPASLVLSPSAANGLEACTPAQFALKSESRAQCPSSSEVATVEAYTPLLPPAVKEHKEHEEGEEGQLKGELFVAEQECSTTKGCNGEDLAAGRLLHLYVELLDPKAGITVKLEGKSKLNPATDRIETSFEELPQLPFEELKVSLRGGQRAPFATAQGCEQTEEADTLLGALTPWAHEPGVEPEVFSAQSKPITLTGCSKQGFEPKFEAGTEYPQAGHYSNFLLRFSRKDGEGDLTGLEVKTPPGLTAKLAGVPTCPEPQASEGECPATSEIGTATVFAGPGTRPYIQRGHVYLTGPYNGTETIGQGACTAGNPGCAPYGLSIVVSTKAGPFTLDGNTGRATQVTRAKIEVDATTAAVNVRSNPLP